METVSNLQRINSTSYADVVGLYLGIERLPGEETPVYLDRLALAACSKRDTTYEGLVNELCFQLGLEVRPVIELTGVGTLTAGIGGLAIQTGDGYFLTPLVKFDADNVWRWRKLSDLVADLNAIPGITATLLGEDAYSIQLCKQAVSLPNDLVGSEVGMFGLLEPGLPAKTPDGGLAYQVREMVQAVMKTDRSYWGR